MFDFWDNLDEIIRIVVDLIDLVKALGRPKRPQKRRFRAPQLEPDLAEEAVWPDWPVI